MSLTTQTKIVRLSLLAGGLLFGCGTEQPNNPGTGGTASGQTGGTLATGGVSQGTGGTPATGGLPPSTGGASGGKASGGTASGGSPSGGSPSGGKASGGTASGGSPSGGTATGGSGTTGDRCDVGVYNSSTPPQALTLSGNLGAHDPAALLVNGTYYEFQTGLGSKTSTNVTSWTGGSRPFTAPSWLTTAVPGVGDLWAPDISYFGGQYHLYYSGSTFGSNRSCIGHATRAAMNSGSWTDQGSATICSNVGTSDNWNAIDPSVELDTAGTPYLVFGSFWSGIKLIQLDQNGRRVGTTVTSIANRPSNGGAVEGPYIVRRCGYYYLFTSWDTCCQGASSTYNIRVARATSITGPYSDKAGTASTQGGGTLIAQTGGSWVGPGGQSVFISGTKAYLIYHAYAASNGAATLRIADLVWDSSGWPMPVGP